MNYPWIKSAYTYLKAAEQDVFLLSSVGDNPFINLMEREIEELLGFDTASPTQPKGLPSYRVVAVSSATAGMVAVLRALGIGKGDEVIVPAFSWGQTLNPVLEVGAIPVFVDVEAGSVNVDLSQVKAARTHRTKAILAAELFGIPLNWEQLEKTARRTGLFTIVDAAQSFGATHKGRWPTAVVFSFGRGKLICGGEGGAVATQSANLYDAILVASQHPIRALQHLRADIPFDELDSAAPNARIHPFAAALVASGIEHFRKHRLKYCQLISRTRQKLTEAGFPPVPLPPLSEQAPPVIPVLTNRSEALFALCQLLGTKWRGEAVFQGWKVEKCLRKPLIYSPTVTKRIYLPALRSLGFPAKKINVRHTCGEYPQASACAKSLYLVHPMMENVTD